VAKIVNVKFYGGVNEIGGNRILVQDGSTKLFLDYGMSFGRNEKFFEEFLQPRFASVGLKDLLRLQLVHDLPGTYRTDLVELMGREATRTPSIDGILLSHIHMDHSAYVSLLDERVPIVCSPITSTYAKAILGCGKRTMETEIYDFIRRPNNRDDPVQRTFINANSGRELDIGNVKVTPYAVDHSVLGANAYLLKTRNATIAYTGDLRLHGKATDLTEKFIEAASNTEPDILLCEGTRINETQSTTENDVLAKSIETVRKSRGLVIADFAYRDMTRLKTFYDVAMKTDRKLVITMKDAHLIQSLTESCELPFELPSIVDENILIYQDRKGSGSYQEKDYRKWERPLLERANIIRAAEVHERAKDLIIHLTFYDFTELIDIDPSQGTTYIHSSSEPYNEEQLIDQERLDNWLDYFDMRKHQFHASGHANGDEIRKIVDRIKPRELIPIHTQHPELFEKIHDNVRMPILQPFN